MHADHAARPRFGAGADYRVHHLQFVCRYRPSERPLEDRMSKPTAARQRPHRDERNQESHAIFYVLMRGCRRGSLGRAPHQQHQRKR